MKLFRIALLLVVVVSVSVCRLVMSGEFEIEVDTHTRTFQIDNPGPAVVPTVYLVGRPDRSAEPVRKTKGLTLNGIRVTENLLSESVLILYPDNTGRWGYHTGFDIFREPQFDGDGERVDPRTLVEYDKWQYDPLRPVTRVGGDMNLLRLHATRPAAPAMYEIAFPPPLRIRWFEVQSNCDQIRTGGVAVQVRLFADEGRQELIAEQFVGPEQAAAVFPVRFEGLDHSRVYLELSAKAPQGMPVGLYYTFFEAGLDTDTLALTELQTGRNEWTIEDDADGSHRARLVLRWEDRPPPEHTWEDFEGPLQWGGCEKQIAGRDSGTAFTGTHFVRATFAANGRDYALNRSLPETDLSRYNRLGLAMRVKQAAPMRAILFGIKNADTAYQYVRPRAADRWDFQSFDISRFRRDRVVAMNVYWMAVPGYDRPNQPCIYDLDTITLWHQELEPQEKLGLPEKIASYRSALQGQKPPERTIPPVQEWFPLGIYDGICGRGDQECAWLFDQMRGLGMNTVYISNGSLEGLERILPLAEARGIRLIYQGGGDGSLYYLPLATATARKQSLDDVILPRTREWLPRFRGRWGLVAWSLTEEIGPELSRELGPYYELVRQLDPDHPPTVLHNNLQAAVADLETNRPLVVTHDFYPFFWSPRSGPSNPTRSIAAYRSHVSSYYRACRQHGASLWMMPQAWGAAESAPLDPPNYGYRQGMRTPEPGEIKLQGWVAIAEGATGLMYYAAVASRPDEHQLWDADWTETANTRAAADLFERVGRVAPLLCRLERDYREADFAASSNPQVIAHSFVKRPHYPGSARYLVLASLDGFGPQTSDLEIRTTARVYDVVERREMTGKLAGLSIGPGEGTVLLVGTADDYQADCRLLGDR